MPLTNEKKASKTALAKAEPKKDGKGPGTKLGLRGMDHAQGEAALKPGPGPAGVLGAEKKQSAGAAEDFWAEYFAENKLGGGVLWSQETGDEIRRLQIENEGLMDGVATVAEGMATVDEIWDAIPDEAKEGIGELPAAVRGASVVVDTKEKLEGLRKLVRGARAWKRVDALIKKAQSDPSPETAQKAAKAFGDMLGNILSGGSAFLPFPFDVAFAPLEAMGDFMAVAVKVIMSNVTRGNKATDQAFVDRPFGDYGSE